MSEKGCRTTSWGFARAVVTVAKTSLPHSHCSVAAPSTPPILDALIQAHKLFVERKRREAELAKLQAFYEWCNATADEIDRQAFYAWANKVADEIDSPIDLD